MTELIFERIISLTKERRRDIIMSDKNKDYKIVISDIVDLNVYDKPPVLCRVCGSDFTKCNPKCAAFYFSTRKKK